MRYELRQIEAWNDGDNTWTYNDSWHIGNYTERGNNGKRAFLRGLHKYGIICNRGVCRVEYDGNGYELIIRKTNEPIFSAVPMDY